MVAAGSCIDCDRGLGKFPLPCSDLSCALIGASFACPDWRSDREAWSGRGDRPSKPLQERWSGGGGGGLHRPRFRKLLIWIAPGSLRYYEYSLGIFVPIWHKMWPGCYDEENIRGRRGWSGRCDRVDPASRCKCGVGSRSAWSWSCQFGSGSVRIRGSWSCDRGAIGQIRDNKGSDILPCLRWQEAAADNVDRWASIRYYREFPSGSNLWECAFVSKLLWNLYCLHIEYLLRVTATNKHGDLTALPISMSNKHTEP